MNTIGIIGMGNMGEAILRMLLQNKIKKENIFCSEIKLQRIRHIEKVYKVKCFRRPHEMVKQCEWVILAVKPQDSRDLLHQIAPFLNEKKIIISIMAGITITNILSVVEKPVKIVRVMPNICMKVGEGAIAITANSLIKTYEFTKIKKMFHKLGEVIEIGEELMNAATALNGSGPAFFLSFLEALIDAGVKMGFTREKSYKFSIQLVKGTLKMLQEEGLHPTLMKEMIASPGGTTISGLVSLEEDAFKGMVIKAVEKAYKRAKELSL